MKKLITIIALALLLIGSAGAAFDPYRVSIGQDLAPTYTYSSVTHGAPRYADDAYIGLGTGSGSSWAAVPDVKLYWDSSDSRFEITSTNAYFDMADVTFYTSDPTNETLTFNGYVPVFGAGWTLADDQFFNLGDAGEGKIFYDESGGNLVHYRGVDFLVEDDTKVIFGNDSNGGIEYDEDGTDKILATGSWSYPSQITSTLATGTSPFAVSSTTVNTNFNADLLDGQEGAYYGTATNQTSQQTEIDACETNATTQQAEIDACETNATTQQAEIDACETNATTQQGEIDTLETRTYLHVQVITDPIVAAADTIEGATAINTGGFTLASGDLDAQPDVPRTLSVTPNGELTGWVLFEGTNIDDEAITEYVNFTASSSLADTTKAFKTLTQVTGAKTAGDDRSITIGQTDELGLDMTVDNDYQLMAVKFDGGIDATQTLVKDGTDVELNNINIAGTLDGSKTVWVYVIVE